MGTTDEDEWDRLGKEWGLSRTMQEALFGGVDNTTIAFVLDKGTENERVVRPFAHVADGWENVCVAVVLSATLRSAVSDILGGRGVHEMDWR